MEKENKHPSEEEEKEETFSSDKNPSSDEF